MRDMWTPWRRAPRVGAAHVQGDPADERALSLSGGLAMAEMFGVGMPGYAGVHVTESSALGVSAVYRAVSLISQTVAAMPTRVVRHEPDGSVVRYSSFLDDPAGKVGLTRFEFWETALLHLLLHGNAYMLLLRNGAGQIAALQPVHPSLVSVDVDLAYVGGRRYDVRMADGRTARHGADTLLHIPGMCPDGVQGYSVLSLARNSLGTTVAADRAAAKQFSSGAMISMIATADDDISPEETAEIKSSLSRSVAGWENAAEIAVINRRLKLTPWTMSAADAQFLESRAFQVEEVARWFGVPPFALMQTDKQTSWGTGIESQQRGLAKTVIQPWVERVSQRVNRLLPAGRALEFDFTGLERADPASESARLVAEVGAGLLTVNEARAMRGLPPLDGGDTPRTGTAPAQEVAP